MSRRGWVKAWRSLFDPGHHLGRGQQVCDRFAWLDLCTMAEHASKPDLARGQLRVSVRFLAKRWHWSRGRVERFLRALEHEHDMIKSEAAERSQAGTVITIVNYAQYQSRDSKLRQLKSSDDNDLDAPRETASRDSLERETATETTQVHGAKGVSPTPWDSNRDKVKKGKKENAVHRVENPQSVTAEDGLAGSPTVASPGQGHGGSHRHGIGDQGKGKRETEEGERRGIADSDQKIELNVGGVRVGYTVDPHVADGPEPDLLSCQTLKDLLALANEELGPQYQADHVTLRAKLQHIDVSQMERIIRGMAELRRESTLGPRRNRIGLRVLAGQDRDAYPRSIEARALEAWDNLRRRRA